MAGSVYEGKTFDEAVRKGLDALRLTRAEAVITTIEEGKGGFLGFGARPYRVSVARRPGGAIKEPAEGGDDRRGGRRGGREERGGRGGERGGRGGREQAATTGRAGRDERGGRAGRDERPARPGRDERPPREERGNRDERRDRDRQPVAGAPARPGREERPPREERAPREERVARDDRPAREERAPREERGPREERAPREDRGERRERGPREERRPLPVQAAGPSPVPPSVSEEGGEDSPRKRRRRGRRGGRGRRRGGADEEDAPMREEAAPLSTNGAHAHSSAEPVPAPQVAHAPAEHVSMPVEPAPVMRAAEPLEHAEPAEHTEHTEHTGSGAPLEAFESMAASEPRADAPSERREPREHREGRGERFRPERHPRHGDEAGSEGSRAPEMNADELAATSKRLTEELLGKMGFEPKVSVRVDGNRVDVTVQVDRDDDLLNGRQGETRLSLQHLLNRFLNRGDGSRYHLQLEVNDFWQQREDELAALARKLADEAVTSNAEVVSDYLNSQERRIVHVTLKEDSRVKTFSLGTGMVKRVAVAPAGFPDRSEDDSAS